MKSWMYHGSYKAIILGRVPFLCSRKKSGTQKIVQRLCLRCVKSHVSSIFFQNTSRASGMDSRHFVVIMAVIANYFYLTYSISFFTMMSRYFRLPWEFMQWTKRSITLLASFGSSLCSFSKSLHIPSFNLFFWHNFRETKEVCTTYVFHFD